MDLIWDQLALVDQSLPSIYCYAPQLSLPTRLPSVLWIMKFIERERNIGWSKIKNPVEIIFLVGLCEVLVELQITSDTTAYNPVLLIYLLESLYSIFTVSSHLMRRNVGQLETGQLLVCYLFITLHLGCTYPTNINQTTVAYIAHDPCWCIPTSLLQKSTL